MIIFCGHFPDGALHFTEEELEDETRAEWYLRQMLGSANFEGGPLLHILSGNLGFQIEHHLFPDLPSNRYAEIAVKVRALCEKYDIPYTTGPLHQQYGQALRTIMKLSLPNAMTSSRPARAAVAVDRPRPADRRRAADAAYRDRWLVARQPDGMTASSEAARDARPRVGHPVRAEPDLRRAARGRSAGRSRSSARRRRSAATPSTCRRCTSTCAEELRRTPGADPRWQLVTTAGFEFVRPAREDVDRRPRFQPNSLL